MSRSIMSSACWRPLIQVIKYQSTRKFHRLNSSRYSSIKVVNHNTATSVRFLSSETVKVEELHQPAATIKCIEDYVALHAPLLYTSEIVKSVCQLLLDIGVTEEKLKKELCMVPVPVIYKQTPKQLREIFSVFQQFSVEPDIALQLINVHREYFHHTPLQLSQVLMQLQEIPVRDLTLMDFITTSPYLLTMDINHVKRMFHNIKSMFPPKELRHLLANYPEILIHPWEATETKIFYINDMMGLDQPHMAYNRCLSHSMSHIKNRHEVLLRLGKYSKPKLNKDRLSYLKNTKMELIMDSTEQHFCSKIAMISPEEWFVFQEMLAEERGEDEHGVPIDSYDEDREYEEEMQELKDSYGAHRKESSLKGYSSKPDRWSKNT